ncbi:hypothetical protein J4477_00650 [Candidatus Pacearchaeota archaeon]|nr:hypothetical protein [Candidatus Pacearchaeota archaeon]
MEKSSRFFKTYFILVIFYAIIGILDSLFLSGMKETFGQISILWMVFVSLFEFAIFILSIIALVVFIKNKLPKVTLIMPIYHLITAVLILIYGFAWGILSAVQGNPIAGQLIPPGMIAIGVISSLFELIFSIYILSKFK